MTKEQTEKKYDKDVDTMIVVDLLRRHADKCGELADTMSREGRPLHGNEKQLVRFAVCPVLDDITDELKSSFLSGNADRVDKSIDAIRHQTTPFMD